MLTSLAASDLLFIFFSTKSFATDIRMGFFQLGNTNRILAQDFTSNLFKFGFEASQKSMHSLAFNRLSIRFHIIFILHSHPVTAVRMFFNFFFLSVFFSNLAQDVKLEFVNALILIFSL